MIINGSIHNQIQNDNLATLFKNQNIPIKSIYILPQKLLYILPYWRRCCKTFSDDCISALNGAGHTALPDEKTPPNRTVFILNIDRDSLTKSEDKLLELINSENHANRASKVVKNSQQKSHLTGSKISWDGIKNH